MKSEMIIHRQLNLGPVVYADRELWDMRVRMIWVFGRLIKSWRVK